jgi:hypothetical protein
VWGKNRRDDNGARDADEDRRTACGRDEKDLVGIVDRIGCDDAGGISGEDRGVGAEIREDVRRHRESAHHQREREDEEIGSLREERDKDDGDEGAREGADDPVDAFGKQHAGARLRHDPDGEPRPIRSIQLQRIGDVKRQHRGQPRPDGKPDRFPHPRRDGGQPGSPAERGRHGAIISRPRRFGKSDGRTSRIIPPCAQVRGAPHLTRLREHRDMLRRTTRPSPM